jgi:hypothetical protein
MTNRLRFRLEACEHSEMFNAVQRERSAQGDVHGVAMAVPRLKSAFRFGRFPEQFHNYPRYTQLRATGDCRRPKAYPRLSSARTHSLRLA